MSTPRPAKYDFFISYARSDAMGEARSLATLLSEHASVFLDTHSIEIGSDWWAFLQEALRDSSTIVVVVSQGTTDSVGQRQEVSTALRLAKDRPADYRIVPVFLQRGLEDAVFGLSLRQGIEVEPGGSMADVAASLLGEQTAFPSGRATSRDAEHGSVSGGGVPLRALRGPVVAREEQTSLLDDALSSLCGDSEASDAAPRLVLIGGASGVGKTTIAEHALLRAHDMGLTAVQTVCEPFHEGMSFFPTREIIRQLLTEPTVAQQVAGYFGRGSAEMLAAEAADDPSAEPAGRRDAQIATLSNLVLGRFRSDRSHPPVVIMLDDMEFIDVGSADALLCLFTRLHEGRVLVVGAYRSDLVESPAGADHPLLPLLRAAHRDQRGTVVRLEQFDSSVMRPLVSSMIGDTRLNQRFLDRLYEETEGNALFIAEIVNGLGLGSHPGSGTVMDPDLDEWKIPATVEDAILRRLDAISVSERADIEIASVIGRRFAFEIMRLLREGDDEELLDRLEALISLNLIRELAGEHAMFEFSHGKIRDVLYHSMSNLRRRRLHGRVADALIALQGVVLSDWDAMVGTHLFLAQRLDAAVGHLAKAGMTALGVHSGHEAAKLLARSIEAGKLSRFPLEWPEEGLRLAYGESLKIAGDYERSCQALQELLELQPTPRVSGWTNHHLGDVYWTLGDYDAAVRCYQDAEAAARQTEDRDLLLCALEDLVEFHDRMAELLAGSDRDGSMAHLERSDRYLDEQLEVVEVVQDAFARSIAYRNGAKRLRRSGDLAGALDMYEVAVSSLDPRLGSHSVLISYAKTLRLAGRTQEARQIVSRVEQWSRQSGALRSRAIALQYDGLLRMEDTAEFDTALSVLEESHALHEEIGYARGIREIRTLLGEWFLRSGNKTRAADWFRRALADLDFEGDDSAIVDVICHQLRASSESTRAALIEERWGEVS